MRRYRKLRKVHMVVSSNFYDLLEQERRKINQNNIRNKPPSFPEFTELIHKDLIFPRCRKKRLL